MLEIVAKRDTEAHGQAVGSPLAPMILVESSHRIILPRRSGEPPFAPRQYCYAASKGGVVPSLLLSAPVSAPDEGSEASAGGYPASSAALRSTPKSQWQFNL
jgi:hypothetical protein